MLSFSGGWDLPIGHGRKYFNPSNRAVRQLASGWQFDWVYTYTSGYPTNWPDLINCGEWHAANQNHYAWFNNNKSCYTRRQSYTFRVVPDRFSDVRNPATKQLNFAVEKITRIRERYRFVIRAEAINISNTPGYGGPDTSFTSDRFGMLPIISRTGRVSCNSRPNCSFKTTRAGSHFAGQPARVCSSFPASAAIDDRAPAPGLRFRMLEWAVDDGSMQTTTRNEQNLLLGRKVALVSIAASCILATSNVWIGFAAGSISVAAAGFEFLGDVLASILVLVGMTLAGKPPDAEHPYGHGRIEILAGLSVGLILSAGGVGICYRSLQQVTEVHLAPALYSVWPLISAIVIRTGMSTMKFRVGRESEAAHFSLTRGTTPSTSYRQRRRSAPSG
jgi:hypothetical protein